MLVSISVDLTVIMSTTTLRGWSDKNSTRAGQGWLLPLTPHAPVNQVKQAKNI